MTGGLTPLFSMCSAEMRIARRALQDGGVSDCSGSKAHVIFVGEAEKGGSSVGLFVCLQVCAL